MGAKTESSSKIPEPGLVARDTKTDRELATRLKLFLLTSTS